MADLKTTEFRGLAGEIVAGFLKPETFLTAIPIAIVFVIGTLLIGAIGLPQMVTVIAMFILSGFIVGRYAMSSVYGDHLAGMFSTASSAGDALNYAIRYTILTILWGLPVFLIQKYILKNMFMYGFDPQSMASAGFNGIIMAITFFIIIVAPTLSYIIAAGTDSIGDLFSAKPWLWLLTTRLNDVICFYASVVGGIVTFYILYFIPLVVLAVVGMSIAGEKALLVLVLFFTPLAASPALIGRLAGAVIAGGNEQSGSDSSGATAVPSAEDILSGKVSLDSASSGTSSPGPASSDTPQSGSVTGPAGGSGEYGLGTIHKLSSEPSDELIKWLREELKNHEAIVSAYLFDKADKSGQVRTTLGIKLSDDTPLGGRQKTGKALAQAARGSPLAAVKGTIILLDDKSALRANMVGLKVYQKK
ncbi:MAG: hypothetical protein D6719_07430, partial [Candidatus Dadabacteria bacterium]